MAAEEVLSTSTHPSIPGPHRDELVRSSDMPPTHLTGAVFVFAVDASDRVLLTYVEPGGRGWDIPGGHLDPGETPQAAAVRELREETGFRVSERELSPVDWTRITLEGDRPAGWRYAYPVGYMVFFYAEQERDGPDTDLQPESECTEARWVPIDEVTAYCPEPDWLLLLAAIHGPSRTRS